MAMSKKFFNGLVAMVPRPGEQERLIKQLTAALKATTAHAIDMTCELNDTDDVSDYPYLARAQSLLRKLEKRSKRASRQR